MLKKCFLFAAALLFACGAFAQRIQKSEFMPMSSSGYATVNYSVINENGKMVKDGPFSVEASYDTGANWEDLVSYENIKAIGTLKKGDFHGPISLTIDKNVQKRNGFTDIKDCKVKGNFIEGRPNGNFTIEYMLNNEPYMKLNVTYKNGRLVGKYHAMLDDQFDISGNFTSDGKMTGVWKFSEKTNDPVLGWGTSVESRTFLNGVETAAPGYDQTLKTYAQQYASKKITFDKLLEKGIIVKSFDPQLYNKIYRLFCSRMVLYWDKIGDFTVFGDSPYPQYLEYTTILNDESIASLKSQIINSKSDVIKITDFVRYDNDLKVYYRYNSNGREYITKAQSEELLQAINEKALLNATGKIKGVIDGLCKQTPEVIQKQFPQAELDAIKTISSFSSYKIGDIKFCNNEDPKDTYIKADVTLYYPIQDTSSSNIIKTYGTITNQLTLYLNESNEVIAGETFKKENIRTSDLGWGQVNKFGAELNKLEISNKYTRDALVKYDKLLREGNKKLEAGAIDELNTDYFKAEYTSILNYVDAVKSYLSDFEKLKQSYVSSTDVLSIIETNAKNIDLRWKSNVADTVAGIEKYDWKGKFAADFDSLNTKVSEFIQKKAQLLNATGKIKGVIDGLCKQTPEVIQEQFPQAELDAIKTISPFSSYKIGDVKFCNNEDPKNTFIKADVTLCCSKQDTSSTNIIKTYETIVNQFTLYLNESNEVIAGETFKKENIRSSDLGWGQVNKFGAELNKLEISNEYTRDALVKYDKLLREENKKHEAGAIEELNTDYFKAEYTSILNYADAVKSYLSDFEKLKQSYVSSTDVLGIVETNAKNIDLGWKSNVDDTVAGIEKYDWKGKFAAVFDSLNTKAREFVHKRDAVNQLNAELNELKDGSAVLVAYKDYYTNTYLNATDLTTAKLDDILAIQGECKKIVSSSDIKKINKEIKKAKLNDINAIIRFANMLQQDYSPEGVNKETAVKNESRGKDRGIERVSAPKYTGKKNGRGYGQYVDVTALWDFLDDGIGVSANINYIGGYRFNKNFFLGLGTGISINNQDGNYSPYKLYDSYSQYGIGYDISYFPHSFMSIPVYLHFRTDFGKHVKPWYPYISLSAGYHFSIAPIGSAVPGDIWQDLERIINHSPTGTESIYTPNKGFMGEINFGINRRLTEKMGMYFGLGFRVETRKEKCEVEGEIDSYGQIINSRSSSDGSAGVYSTRLSIGLTF